jgi:hypothetical protein
MAAKYKEYMHELDAHADAYERDRKAYITEAYDSANRPTGRRLVEKREEAVNKMQSARAQARMSASQKKSWMEDQLRNGPKEEFYVEPKIVSGIIGGNPTSVAEGYMIRMNGVSVYLKPGMNKAHPLIAERYRQITDSKKGTQKRKELLSANKSWKQVAEGMHQINEEHGSTSGSGQSGDNWLTPDVYQEF